MKIIILSGKAQVGKDTFAKKIQEHFGKRKVFIAAYADMLKVILKRNFKYTGIKDEEERRVMQKCGDMFRRADKTFFIDIVRRILYAVLQLNYDYFIITDARFDNEISCIKNDSFLAPHTKAFRLVRDSDNSLGETRNHASEQGVSNYLIDAEIHLENNIDYDITKYLDIIIGEE